MEGSKTKFDLRKKPRICLTQNDFIFEKLPLGYSEFSGWRYLL